ncbi:MAG TPA: HAMP domain-containing sensor histidine kinase [Pseudonocardia sp.]
MLRARSLRTRLVALTLLLLAVASIAVGLVTALAVRQSLISRLDTELLAISSAPGLSATNHSRQPNGNGANSDSGGPDGYPNSAGPGGANPNRGLPPSPDLIAVAVLDNQVLDSHVHTRAGGDQTFPEGDLPTLLAVPPGGRPVTLNLPELGAYRVVAVRHLNGVVGYTGLPEGALQQTIANLVTTELVVAAITLGIAGVIGAVVVRRELEPLERVAATARRVSMLPLDRGEVQLAERVPDADPDTEVGQVGAALNRMLDHVGAALEARQDSEMQLRQFVADASHELRTPLAAIRGYAELSRRGPLSDEATYSLLRISSQAERMTTLVEDLLLLARLDAGRPLERVDVDLTRLVLDAVSDAHAAGSSHHWQLDLPEEPVIVSGDPSRLTQVITNLLANARTHTPPGTAVRVTLAAGAGTARVTVADEGPGIPPDLLPHVFERFARGSSSRSRENGSTGLGLAIVHAVMAAHGGGVSVTSRPGDTEFTVRLPIPHPALLHS